MSNTKILRINHEIVLFRKLCSFDYEPFLNLTKERILERTFINKYLYNKIYNVKVGTNIYMNKLLFAVFYRNNKLCKFIINPKYNINEIVKSIDI